MGRYRSSSRSSGSSCLMVTGIGCGTLMVIGMVCAGVGMYFGWRQTADAQKELTEANRLWDAGQTSDAVSMYREVLKRNVLGVPSGSERALPAIDRS